MPNRMLAQDYPSGTWVNTVAKMIAGDHMDPDKAAQKWIAANKAKVNKWLGK